MLYLSRKVGESIIINNTIEVTVMEVRGRVAKLGLDFPANVSVLRKEVHDRILQQNQAAIGMEGDFGEDIFSGLEVDLETRQETPQKPPTDTDDPQEKP